MNFTENATDTDEALAARGTREAYQALYSRHAPALLAFLATRAAGADRDDLHQEIWLTVWQQLPGGFRGGNFRAWLFTIARHRLIDRHRRRRPDQLDDEGNRTDSRPENSPLWAILEQERQVRLASCLERLDGVNASAGKLVRGRLGGEQYDSLCRQLGISENKAYKLWHEAVRVLQACVDGGDR